MPKYRNISREKNKFYKLLNLDKKMRKLISFFNVWKKEASKEQD